MSHSEEASETTPLLRERQEGAASAAAADRVKGDSNTTNGETGNENEDQEQQTAKIEAIKEALPLRMVIISLASLLSCLFVVGLDGTLIVTLLNDISSAFSSSDLIFWLGTSYTLAMCAVAPIYGRLNDIIGRKNAIISAVSVFLIGAFFCTISPSMLTLIAARAVAGAGGGGMTTCVSVILGDLVPLRQRGLYQAVAQVVFSLGNAAGGPVGGILTDLFGWRIALATKLPVLVLSLFLLSFFLQIPSFPKTQKEQERQAKEAETPMMKIILKRLDLSGSLLLVLACLTLMFALSFLSADNLPLSNIKVWANLAASAIFTILFILVEVKFAKEPILPMSLLRNRTVASAAAIYFFICAAMAMMFYFPIYFRSVLLQSASQTGVHFLSATICTTVGAFFSGALMKKTGTYKKLLLFSCALCLVTPIWLSTWTDTVQPSPWAQNLVLAPVGFGVAAISTILVVSSLAASNRESHAVIIGLLYLSRSLGTIVGISVFGAQLQYLLTIQLGNRIKGKDAGEVIDKIRKNANIVVSLPPEQKKAAIQSYSASLQVFHICISALMFICLILALLVKEHPLDGGKTHEPEQRTDPESVATETTSEEAEVQGERSRSD